VDIREAAAANMALDLSLYHFALDLFWRRVAVMARVTQMAFPELPQKYHSIAFV
jgi:hypothetical protein